MRIMLTGAGGFLGSRLFTHYREKYEVWAPFHKELDFTRKESARKAVQDFHPDVLLHCGAISDVGACERDPELSMRVNVEGTRYLARACKEMGTRMVMCSSDQVYFRKKEEKESLEEYLRPHREEEHCSPVPVYGKHKLLAEAACFAEQPDSVILRLTWMYGKLTEKERRKGRRNLADTLAEMCLLSPEKAEKKKQTFLTTDYRGVTDVTEVVRQMEAAWKLPPGIYNFGSSASGSMYENITRALEGTPSEALAEPLAGTEGPRNLIMDPEKTADARIHFPDTAEGIRRYVERHLKN